jgi:hypothetical protein
MTPTPLLPQLEVSLSRIRKQFSADSERFFALFGLLPGGALSEDFDSIWGADVPEERQWKDLAQNLLKASLIEQKQPSRTVEKRKQKQNSAHKSHIRKSRRSMAKDVDDSYEPRNWTGSDECLSIKSQTATVRTVTTAPPGGGLFDSMGANSTTTTSDNLSLGLDYSGAPLTIKRGRRGSRTKQPSLLYSTFPFVSNYAIQLLENNSSRSIAVVGGGLVADDGTPTTRPSSSLLEPGDLFLFQRKLELHFASVTDWLSNRIGTMSTKAVKAYYYMELHETNIWACLERCRKVASPPPSPPLSIPSPSPSLFPPLNRMFPSPSLAAFPLRPRVRSSHPQSRNRVSAASAKKAPQAHTDILPTTSSTKGAAGVEGVHKPPPTTLCHPLFRPPLTRLRLRRWSHHTTPPARR